MSDATKKTCEALVIEQRNYRCPSVARSCRNPVKDSETYCWRHKEEEEKGEAP